MDVLNLFIKKDDEYKKVSLSNSEELENFFKENSDDKGHLTEDVKMLSSAEVELKDDGVNFVMSDETLNRFEFRVKTEGLSLKNYKKNPVLLWSHDSSIPAIGKMENLRKADGKLTGKAVFASQEVDQFAWSIGEKVKQGIISAGSIGFRVIDVDVPSKPKKDGTTMTVVAGDLEEFSICNVPANPNALVKNQLSKDNDVTLEKEIKVPSVKIDYIESLFSERNHKTSDLENLFEKKDENNEINKTIFGEKK